MDGGTIVTIISSSVIVSAAIGGGFWRLINMISEQSKWIGRLEGKMDGLHTRMHSYEKQLEGFDQRIDRLDRRINGFIESREGN